MSVSKVTDCIMSVEDERNLNMEHWWKQTVRGEKRSTRRRARPNLSFATTHHKLNWLWSNPTSAITDRQITTQDTARP